MIRIGVTGGIGSGKTIITKAFKSLDIDVYNCDIEAKKLTASDAKIKEKLNILLGGDIYDVEGRLNKKRMASLIFTDTNLLMQANAIIHPVVKADFVRWTEKRQKKGNKIVICESAILFESGLSDLLDKTVCVSAPMNIRIQRVMQREGMSFDQVCERIINQMPESVIERKADFVVRNDDRHRILPQILDIIKLSE